MNTKSLQTKVLMHLSDGHFHSGEVLGAAFGVSRAAIWKAIKSLQHSGLSINNIRGRGYQLVDQVELLDEKSLSSYLKDISLPPIHIFDSIGSTNKYLSQQDNLESGTLCLAEQQTAGRGRMGRAWFSPYATNLALSCYWCFQSGASKCIGLSLAVGVALVKALEDCGYSNLGLKWPNDLYFEGKKLAGILVEMSGDLNGPCNTVIGIGLNINMPEEAATAITQPWTDLKRIKGDDESRNKIAAHIIRHLLHSLRLFEQQGLTAFMSDWDTHDILKNQAITLHLRDQKIQGIAKGVDHQGCLLVESDGQVTTYSSGEVSIRLANAFE